MNDLIDLRGRNALVTGASRGVGRAVALQLARAGASVGIAYRSRGDEAETVADEVRRHGVGAWTAGGDLSRPEAVDGLFARASREFDGLDIFVGNHGIWPTADTPVSDISDERWHATMAADLHSVFYTCRSAARMLRPDGRLVLIGSTAGQRGEAFHADYAAAKGAMGSFVKSFCIELAPRGITVNCVAPGWVDTEMSATAYRNGGRERIAESIPIGRIATAEDVAGPVVFLCSELGRHVTGEILNVNGGAVLAG